MNKICSKCNKQKNISNFTKDSSIDDNDFEKSWSLENLQPMWGKGNCSKGKKGEKICVQ